jgi:hypothetical protein
VSIEPSRAFLKDSRPVDSVPLESPALIVFKDGRTGEPFKGYLVDVDALTTEELQKIYADIKGRFPNAPVFDSWVEVVKMEGMPIREERVTSVSFDLRMLI